MIKSVEELIKTEDENFKRLMDARDKVFSDLHRKKVELNYKDDIAVGLVRNINFATRRIEIELTDTIDWNADRCTPNGNPILNIHFSMLDKVNFKVVL